MSKHDDVHIQILKWAYEKRIFTWEELTTQFKEYESFLRQEQFFDKKGPFTKLDDNSGKFILSFDGRFRLIEYDQLQDARENAKSANRIATISIVFTLLALIGSIYATFFYTSDVNVSNIKDLKNWNNCNLIWDY